MSGGLPILSRAPVRFPSLGASSETPQPSSQKSTIPTTRLGSATPPTVNNCLHDSPSTLAPSSFPRKKLALKKSKLALLVSGREKVKPKETENAPPQTGHACGTERGVEIYVDPTEDPDIGEILMVRRRKSRAGLDGVGWDGTLHDVTNGPSAPLKPKVEQKESQGSKWWSIGRGRRDSKEKEKQLGTKSVTDASDSVPTDPRIQRDSHRSIAQVASPSAPLPSTSTATSTVRRVTMPPKDEVIYLPSDRETESQAVASNLLALPPPAFRTNGGGSIATRAIRSMQSLARMASWAQLKGDGQGSVRGAKSKSQAKEKDTEKEKKTKKPIEGGEHKVKTKSKDKEIGPPKRKKKTIEDKDKARVVTVRASTSSFEAGALTASPERGKAMSGSRSTDLRLGPDAGAALGLPPSVRLPVARDGGSTSSVSVRPQSRSGMRLAVDGHAARVRPDSAMSTTSSVRPLSSECSPRSKMSTESGGSAMSVSVRWDEDELEKRKKERETKEKQISAVSAVGAESVRGSGRLSDGRKRAPLSGVFPAAHVPPIVTVEEASSDGHGSFEPPPLRRRPRPVSDLPLGRSRATSIREETEGIMTALDAATDDLAYLITHIHVDTTPGSTPNGSSRALSPRSTPGGILREEVDSPLRRSTLRRDGSSISSLRPYSHRNMPQPAPTVPPPAVPIISTGASTSRLIGKQIKPWPKSGSNSEIKPTIPHRSITVPASRDIASPAPDAEPVPVVRPLRPARARLGEASLGKHGLREQARQEKPPLSPLTESSFEQRGSGPTSRTAFAASAGLPIAPDVKRVLGMTGTMGTSVGALGDDEKLFDADDPDSDIPEELQAILADTAASRAESPLQAILQPEFPVIAEPQVPTFLVDHAGDNDNGSSSEEDTKKSFDFTDELRKLNESGASDRASFVEQLENAFRTPARIDLCSDFFEPEHEQGQDASWAPPLAELPTPPPTVFEVKSTKLEYEAASCCIAETWDASLPALVDASNLDDLPPHDQADNTPLSPTGSKRNDDHLTTALKYGNPAPPPPQHDRTFETPLTLSDIIPPISPYPPAFDSSGIVEEDSEILNSIYAQAMTDPPPTLHVRLDSDSSLKRLAREAPVTTSATSETLQAAHGRRPELSFADADTCEQARCSFELSQHRAPFYPLRPAAPRNRHGRQASGLTIATNSSYGACITLGSKDPFEYVLPLLEESQSSEYNSDATSVSVEDTFAFLRQDLRPRQRSQSDASAFSFHASAGPGQTTDKLAMSLSSQDPPYNSQAVGHALHRRQDSSSSEGSIALSYAMYGAKGGCAAWARHNRQESSPDSLLDEFSMLELGRPGLGEKMLDSSRDSVPSPSTSTSTSHGSFVDRPSSDHAVNVSILGGDEADSIKAGHSPQPRLLSAPSTESDYDPSGGDETIFNMLGGGYVRRGSVSSAIVGSPSMQMSKRKLEQPAQEWRGCPEPCLDKALLKASRILEEPSITSASSYLLGSERMIKAPEAVVDLQNLKNVADGGDLRTSVQVMPVFTRPISISCSGSSTCSVDTPPLSPVASSFQSEGSQSSIDFAGLDVVLSAAAYAVNCEARTRARARPRGAGHRRHTSRAPPLPMSVYDTIQEELSNGPNSSALLLDVKNGPTAPQQSVIVVDAETASIDLDVKSAWDDEKEIITLRKFYALRDEADNILEESRRLWEDTPFSVFAVQSFCPPQHPLGMQALLDHSLQNYGRLPFELRPRPRRRSRTFSRPTPYPPRSPRTSLPADQPRPSVVEMDAMRSQTSSPLRAVPNEPNVNSQQPVVSVYPIKHGDLAVTRARVTSDARRAALGWAQKKAPKQTPTKGKENVSFGQGTATPSESLKIKRPRPRSRLTPASLRVTGA